MKIEEIEQYVEKNKQEAIDFLVELLKTPSPTGQEYEVSQLVKKTLEQEGFDPKIYALKADRPNIIMDWVGNKKGKKFLFNGHYDVFPPSKDFVDAWSGKIIGDSIYGCGAADMKTGLSAAIMAIKFLKRLDFKPNGTITLSCDCDEEQGGKYGALYLISQGLLNADFGICMEASEDLVICESDGRIAYQVTYSKEGWHAGLRKKEKSAIQKAHIAIDKLMQYDNCLKKTRFDEESQTGAILSVTEIKAGNIGKVPNMHSHTCSFSIDRRYTRGETVESVTNELKEILDELKINDPEMDYILEMPFASPQLKMDLDSEIINKIIEAYKIYCQKTIKRGRRCGGGDTAKITEAYHFPIPQFGPGQFNQLGSNKEHISLKEYIQFIKMYMYIVIKMLGDETE